MKTATYSKLRSGDWGVRVKGGVPKAGELVRVKKKSGETKEEEIEKVLWSGDGDALCAIRKSASSSSSSSGVYSRGSGGRSNGRCRGCGGPVVNVRHHRAMGGYCGSCAFDEFDC